MGQQSATGSGPNKKLAKRAAAEVKTFKQVPIENAIDLGLIVVISVHVRMLMIFLSNIVLSGM